MHIRWFLPIAFIHILAAKELTTEQTYHMKMLYLQNGCNGCHGNYGEGMGASPRLQGQKEEALLRRLTDIKNGKTRTAFGTIMVSFAKSLDENQTIQMARFLSELKTEIPKERYRLEFKTSGDGGS